MLKVLIALLCFGYIYVKLVGKIRKPTKRKNKVEPKIVRRPQQSPNTSTITDIPIPSVAKAVVPHKKQTHLATNNEQRLHSLLLDILPPEYTIHSQVSLMALVTPISFKDNSKTWAKRMDFVITDKDTKVLAVIELDDSSHNRKKRIERDEYVNSVLDGHHPLIRVKSVNIFNRDQIIGQLEDSSSIQCRDSSKRPIADPVL